MLAMSLKDLRDWRLWIVLVDIYSAAALFSFNNLESFCFVDRISFNFSIITYLLTSCDRYLAISRTAWSFRFLDSIATYLVNSELISVISVNNPLYIVSRSDLKYCSPSNLNE